MTPVPPAVDVLLQGSAIRSDQGSTGFCGVYLVRGRILYDCGHVGRRRALVAALAGRGLTPADIEVVVVSHGHWDHIQNADLFTRARVLMHARELRYLSAPAADDPVTPPWTAAVLAAADVRETGEGDEIGPDVRVVELPGHTPGSIGLAVGTPDGTAVLTGDAVATAKAFRTGRASNVFHDTALADASVARVARLADIVYPGHDLPFRSEGRTVRGAHG